jgi:hypothetical protein
LLYVHVWHFGASFSATGDHCLLSACACPQDHHPPLPENVSQLLDDFLLKCFQKVGSGTLALLLFCAAGAAM